MLPECSSPVLVSVDDIVQVFVSSLQLSHSHRVKMIKNQTKTILRQHLDICVLLSYWLIGQ